MTYLSVCSGIEAATVAWHPLGFTPAAFSEIEKFPCAVLSQHYPDVPNWGDLTKFKDWPDADIDLLVGGTPCQSFSVAGLREGLDDPRGQLTLTYLAVARKYRPTWLVWENVPGVLSADGGRAFGSLLGGLAELGYGFAYRILDAQYFGLAQRRRRVFVVGHFRDWRRAAAVLFERESLSGHPAPRREAGQDVAGTFTARARSGGWNQDVDLDASGYMQVDDQAHSLRARSNASHRADSDTYIPEIVPQAMSSKWSKGSSGPAGDEIANLIAHSLKADGFDASEDGTGRGTPLIAETLRNHPRPGSNTTGPITLAIRGRGDSSDLEIRTDGTANALLTPNGGRGGIGVGAIAFSAQDNCRDATSDMTPTMRAQKDSYTGGNLAVATQMQVRRLTPRECERLQGFPDDYTLIPYRGKPAADGPRYKALGNSMAVPVMRWIGQRMQMVDALG